MTGAALNGDLGRWSAADGAALERAVDTYRELIAVLDACRDRETDPVKAAQLRADADRYAAEQRRLDVDDQVEVARVIAEYGPLVRQLRASLQQ